MRMNPFKEDLKNFNSIQVFRKYILSSHSPIIEEDILFNMKEKITNYFNIEYNDIVLVGSAKLGFSIKPKKRYVNFGDNSDIDIAIASTPLFTKIWKEAIDFENSKAYWPEKNNFFKYLAHGWIRPDKLPNSEYFKFTNEWWEFFNELTASGIYGHYKIRGGLYHSWFFLQNYQTICIDQCIQEYI